VSLQADVQVRLPGFDLAAPLDVADGETVAVVGPNGAGKSTLLRALAGLVAVAAGRVVVDGMVLDDVAAGVHVYAERRPVGVVFQDYLLFPHLSALDNVAFGPRSRGVGKVEARRQAQAWLERVGLGDLAERRPRALSGGQAQRVALARALIGSPRLLLLDEPLAAVDMSARAELRRVMRQALADFDGSRVLVTHDPLEAAALADRIVVLEAGPTEADGHRPRPAGAGGHRPRPAGAGGHRHGHVAQEGTVAEVTARPRSPWIAQMVGLNLLRGRAQDTTVRLDSGAELITAQPAVGEVFAVVHPRAVALHRTAPETSARNVFAGTILSVDLEGDRARVQVRGAVPLVAEVTPAAVAALRLDDAGPIWVSFKATELDVYPV
jgi:molybdate transport system ATP-binding protein